MGSYFIYITATFITGKVESCKALRIARGYEIGLDCMI